MFIKIAATGLLIFIAMAVMGMVVDMCSDRYNSSKLTVSGILGAVACSLAGILFAIWTTNGIN